MAKQEERTETVDVSKMIDQLVANAQKALEEYMSMSQEQVDEIVHAMALAGLDQHMYLAQLAYDETKRGVMEDKVIKNLFATEYIWHNIKKQKTVGVIDENDINKARIDGDFEVATEGRYVVSADAFAAIKSGETFKFPYNGYALNVGAGISNALNFRASIEKIDAIVERYGEDKVLGVIDFKDKNELPVEIGVEMECTEYSSTHITNQAYVYRIEGDKLVLITDKAEYDAARDVVSFSTNKLGTLVISAEPLTDAADAPATTTESKDNPGTGANDVIGLAVAGAVVAMAAGFVALKK